MMSDTVARTRQINFSVFNEENRDNKSKTGAAVVLVSCNIAAMHSNGT